MILTLLGKQHLAYRHAAPHAMMEAIVIATRQPGILCVGASAAA